MSKRVLVIETSLRANSNSDALAAAFAEGAAQAGHTVETVSLKGKDLRFCTGCLACQKTGKCVIQDDAPAIVEQMRRAEVLVFATPIYYYEMCGQMKTLLDRANPLYPGEYDFREVYLLATAADEERSAVDAAVKGLEGWVACFEKATFSGVVFGGGADGAGTIQENPALEEARALGRSL